MTDHAPQIHHSHQGIRYAATVHVPQLQAADAQISLAERGCCLQNGSAERLARATKKEEVDLSKYEDYTGVPGGLRRFFNDMCSRRRIHSALKCLTLPKFKER